MSSFQRPRSRAHLLVLAACVTASLAYGLGPRWPADARLERALCVAGSAVTPGLGVPLAAVVRRARGGAFGIW
jgi:hypothetical protein